MQNKTSQGQKVVSPVLNRLAKWAIFVLNRVWSPGDSAYERGGDARRKFWIKPLKETDLGVVQPPKIFLTPKRDHAEIYTPKRDDEHPDPFPMLSPPRVWRPWRHSSTQTSFECPPDLS